MSKDAETKEKETASLLPLFLFVPTFWTEISEATSIAAIDLHGSSWRFPWNPLLPTRKGS